MHECGPHFQTGILTARNPYYPPSVVLCLAEIRRGSPRFWANYELTGSYCGPEVPFWDLETF